MTQAGPGICDCLRKCLCGCGLRVACATCSRRVECRLLLLRGPRWPMEKDGTGPAPPCVVHRARSGPKPALQWGPPPRLRAHYLSQLEICAAAGGNHGGTERGTDFGRLGLRGRGLRARGRRWVSLPLLRNWDGAVGTGPWTSVRGSNMALLRNSPAT